MLPYPSADESPPASTYWQGTTLLIAVLAALLFACRGYLEQAVDPPARAAWICRLKRSRWAAQLLLVCLLSCLVIVPVANLAFKAGVIVTQQDEVRQRQWSPVKLVERLVAAPGEHAREISWSLQSGLVAASAALAIAVPLAWLGRRGRAMILLMLGMATLLAIPGPVWGLTTIRLLNWPTDSWLAGLTYLYDRTLLGPWIVQSMRALPISTLVVWGALVGVPSATLENAALEGASGWRRLLFVALPQIWPSVLAAWLVAAMISCGELTATILVQPPGVTTLPNRLFSLLHYGVEDRVAAISLVMILSLVVLTAWAAMLLARRDRNVHPAETNRLK